MNKDKTIEKGAGFTPGPWAIELGKEHYLIEGEKGVRVALIENWTNVTPEANARLIASAPELYEQFKLLERMLASGDLSATHDGLTNCNMLAQVREILAKVDGGEG